MRMSVHLPPPYTLLASGGTIQILLSASLAHIMTTAGYLYAFKYRDMRCTIDDVPCVLVKFGMVVGWANLMARFANHQSDTTRTFDLYPRLPKHGQTAAGEVALYERNCRNDADTVSVSDVEDVLHAMSNDYIAGMYKDEDDVEERDVWPDLAYIVPAPNSHANFLEGVVPWSLATYLDQTHLKGELNRLHGIRYPTAESKVSHTETLLMTESSFDKLRELFKAGILDMNTISQLTLGVREGPSEETEEALIEWRNANNNRRTMTVRYFKPFYSPETAEVRQGLGLMSRHG